MKCLNQNILMYNARCDFCDLKMPPGVCLVWSILNKFVFKKFRVGEDMTCVKLYKMNGSKIIVTSRVS